MLKTLEAGMSVLKRVKMKTIKEKKQDHSKKPSYSQYHPNIKRFLIVLVILFFSLSTVGLVMWCPKPLVVNYFLPNKKVKEMIIFPIGSKTTITIDNEDEINNIYKKVKEAVVSPRYMTKLKCYFSEIKFVFNDDSFIYISEGTYIDRYNNDHWYDDCNKQLRKLIKETYTKYSDEEPCSCNN